MPPSPHRRAHTLLSTSLAAALLAAPALGLAQEDGGGQPEAAECPSPTFRYGDQVWYAVARAEYATEQESTRCVDEDGQEGRIDALGSRNGKALYRCSFPLEVPEAVAGQYQSELEAQSEYPPTRRRPLRQIWEAVVARQRGALACETGQVLVAELEEDQPAARCGQELGEKQLCPAAGFRLVATEAEGGPVTYACVRQRCEAGQDLGKLGGSWTGCAACPAGVPDLRETAAWKTDLEPGAQPDEILCRALRKARCTAP